MGPSSVNASRVGLKRFTMPGGERASTRIKQWELCGVLSKMHVPCTGVSTRYGWRVVQSFALLVSLDQLQTYICMNVTASAGRKNYRTTEDNTLGATAESREMTTMKHDCWASLA